MAAAKRKSIAKLCIALGLFILAGFFRQLDRVTAPLHGYAGVEDYYRRCSCRQYLGTIAVPTLILHARDDPFLYPDAIPTAG